MNYGEKVLSRLLSPGVLLIVIGAVFAYGSAFFASRLAPNHPRANLICKAVGCAVAIVGALVLFA